MELVQTVASLDCCCHFCWVLYSSHSLRLSSLEKSPPKAGNSARWTVFQWTPLWDSLPHPEIPINSLGEQVSECLSIHFFSVGFCLKTTKSLCSGPEMQHVVETMFPVCWQSFLSLDLEGRGPHDWSLQIRVISSPWQLSCLLSSLTVSSLRRASGLHASGLLLKLAHQLTR